MAHHATHTGDPLPHICIREGENPPENAHDAEPFRDITALGLEVSRSCVWRAGLDLDTRLAANNTELGRNAGCLGLKKENQAALMQGMVTALEAKARNMRAFLWAALGKDCIRMRQDRAKSEVIRTHFSDFFLKKGD